MTTGAATTIQIRDSDARLEPDPSRVYQDIFMPGEELPGDHSRATAVINRVLDLGDEEVAAALDHLHARFADRPNLDRVFQRHYDTVAHRLGTQAAPPPDYQLLIGSYFTHDVAPEGAALTNPSIVPHPDQPVASGGRMRFVLSARAIGEGHISSIEFRTGVIAANGGVEFDPLSGHLTPGRRESPVHDRSEFWAQLAELGSAGETAHLVLDRLGPTFGSDELDTAIGRLDGRLLTRQASRGAVARLRWIADNNYRVGFDSSGEISERVLVPTGSSEANGIEDARFVRFVDDDGAATYLATYTAYDGRNVTPQILRTDDFATFTAHQLAGPAAKNKGMALFPRRIDGRRACLSRWDRERSFVAWSDDGLTWDSATVIDAPRHPWGLIQVGNCGSPLETPEGWLVLTHAVGPMRTYTIGALLLDLDNPSQVIGALASPLMVPDGSCGDGYVPNVVYSCGAMLHGDDLVLPYGCGDQSIGMAAIDLPSLMEGLRGR